MTTRRLIILTEGHTGPITSKTAASVVRYRPSEVVALLDSRQAGKTAEQLLGTGHGIPIVARLEEAHTATALMIGIAPPGGRIPEDWRAVILEAISRGMDVVSGLHDFLSDDVEFAAAAEEHRVQLIDVRKNEEHDVAHQQNIREDCLRIQTIGNDCCVGKMVVAIEITRGLIEVGHDAKFVATGQTGILIEGEGCSVDCVVSDFVNGATEKLVLANQDHEIIVFEGQGSLAHPRYSSVTLGLLHGALPHGLILCYEVGRQFVHNMETVPLKSLAELRGAYEAMAHLMQPAAVVGVAMNSYALTAEAAEEERERVRADLGLPVCDVYRHGPAELVEAVLSLQQRRQVVPRQTPANDRGG